MKNIELYTICKNEEVIILSFLKHYSKICSKITIYDNQSTDNTLSIIEDFRNKTSCEIVVIEHNTNGQLRDDLYITIKNNCWKGSTADYVLIVDCDEFLQINMSEIESNSNVDIFRTEGYEMVGDSLNIDEITHGKIEDNYSKLVMFNPNTISEINYSIGAHKSTPHRKDNNDVVYSDKCYKLFHYKYIQLDYVVRKYHENNKSLSEYNKGNGFGIQYTWDISKITEYYINLTQHSLKLK
jgi:glycosyltransferase involved in cell wall biosynthesis